VEILETSATGGSAESILIFPHWPCGQQAIWSVYLAGFRVCAWKFIYLLVTWKRHRGHSRHHRASGMSTSFIKLYHKEGRNSHVTQDHIGASSMSYEDKYVQKGKWTYELPCAHKKCTDIDGQKSLFGVVTRPVRL
jgi:hypothetical protein